MMMMIMKIPWKSGNKQTDVKVKGPQWRYFSSVKKVGATVIEVVVTTCLPGLAGVSPASHPFKNPCFHCGVAIKLRGTD
jgi:hypothetical protein